MIDDALPDLSAADRAADAAWTILAADLSRESGVTVTWCVLGFRVPTRAGGFTYVSSPGAAREALRGTL